MAFPSVVGSTTFTRATNATSSAVPYPTVSGGILVNDVIFVVHGIDANASRITVPAGWNTLGEVQSATADGVAYWKPAAGGETGTFTVSHTSERDSAIILVIRGVHTTSAPELTWGTAYTTANPDPPSETASWGAEDNLWIAGFFNDAVVVASAAPTNYTNLTTITGDTSNASCSLAYRQLNAATENPGTFTAAAEEGVAFTVVFRPVAGGSTQFQTITATATGTPTLLEQMTLRRTLTATATGTATLVKRATKSLTVTATGTATLGMVKTLFTTLAATATGTATLNLQSTLRRTLTATATGTPTLVRSASKTLAATGTGTASLTKRASKTLAATGTGTASLALASVVRITLTATATGTASLVKTAMKLLSATSTGTATQNAAPKGPDAFQTISATATGTPSLSLVFIPKSTLIRYIRNVRAHLRPDTRGRGRF